MLERSKTSTTATQQTSMPVLPIKRCQLLERRPRKRIDAVSAHIVRRLSQKQRIRRWRVRRHSRGKVMDKELMDQLDVEPRLVEVGGKENPGARLRNEQQETAK